MKGWWTGILLLLLALAGCQYEEKTREIGYKGKARLNPWLAAERFCERRGFNVLSTPTWHEPDWGDAVWLMPASIPSNESFVRSLEDWVMDGGHLILMLEHADTQTDDWSRMGSREELPSPVLQLCKRAGMEVTPEKASTKSIRFEESEYKVDASSNYVVAVGDGADGLFSSKSYQDGRITVMCDARPFRNRWIADQDHAALLAKLIEATGEDGSIGFIRGAGLSLWDLVKESLLPVMIGVATLLFLWLWKNLTRFGPVESGAEPAILRGYDHHLEALGGFQWRLDRAAALISPLQAQLLEAAERECSRKGIGHTDDASWLSERSGLPKERVLRALDPSAPSDSGALTRMTSDLQTLLQSLR